MSDSVCEKEEVILKNEEAELDGGFYGSVK